MTDIIQNEGLEASVIASLEKADSATQTGDNVSDLVNDAGYLVAGDLPIPVITKETFFALAEKRIRDSVGSGDAHVNMKFEDYFTTPATTANEMTLEARTRMVNGIEYFTPQVTLTLPEASDVDTLLSNQTLIMFETTVINVSVSDAFYVGADGDSAAVTWSGLTDVQKTNYTQDFKNNIYNDNGELKQYVFNHVVTNLTQDYAKGDPQAIIDAGYTQGAVGDTYVQWTKAGVEAVPVCKVQRRNQGAYDVALNPEGTNTDVSGDNWYKSGFSPATTSECFSQKGANGSISSATSGRSYDKFFDAIYASDIDDLRMSSRRRPLSEIREEAKRKAIAGEIRGFEGVPFTTINSGASANLVVRSSNDYFSMNIAAAGLVSAEDVIGRYIKWADGSDVRQWFITSVGDRGAGEWSFYIDASRSDLLQNTINNSGWLVIDVPQLHSQANPTWTDIIGDPARIAATFPDGVEGQWIPVVDSGPNVEYKYSRKILDINDMNGEYTEDDGASWAAATSWGADSTTNSTVTSAWAPPRVNIIHYETQAHFTRGDTNRKALDLGDVFATNDNNISNGNLLLSSLMGKVGTGDAEPRNQNVTLINNGGFINGIPNTIAGNEPTHSTLNLGATTNPAIKTRSYLSERNNIAMLTLNYKEMVYDGSWGDNDKFEITSNQSTLTDDNGNTVLYGTASFNTQYFIVEE